MSDDRAIEGSGRRIELAILSRQGGRAANEDACGHWHSDRCLCCVVADGAGGHGGGDVASRFVVRHVIERASASPPGRPDELRDLLFDTNAELRQRRSASAATADMHSTVVVLCVDLASGQAIWGHAGDSRLYLFREGRMVGHTHDHSVVQTMVESGLLMPEQARRHARRSELQSALGSAPEQLVVSTSGRPWPIDGGDAFLLCTDGLWEWVEDERIGASLAHAPSPTAWLVELEELVVRQAAQAGDRGHDNYTGLAVWVSAH